MSIGDRFVEDDVFGHITLVGLDDTCQYQRSREKEGSLRKRMALRHAQPWRHFPWYNATSYLHRLKDSFSGLIDEIRELRVEVGL